jgi:hypothetical protein
MRLRGTRIASKKPYSELKGDIWERMDRDSSRYGRDHMCRIFCGV